MQFKSSTRALSLFSLPSKAQFDKKAPQFHVRNSQRYHFANALIKPRVLERKGSEINLRIVLCNRVGKDSKEKKVYLDGLMIDKIDIFSCHNHINEQLFRRNCFEYFGYFGCFGLNCRENREYYHPHPIRDLSVPRNYHHPPATFPYPQVLVTKYDQGMPCCTLL